MLAGMENFGHEKGLKLQDYDELNLMCVKLSPEEGVVMEVVVKIYLVFPRASEGPLFILGTPRCKTFG